MEIYTDGGCIENPGGIGAWAFVVVANGQVIHKASGSAPSTTNNRMELTAVIEAMKWSANNDVRPQIFTDSDLTVKCGNGQWKRRANLDLWGDFLALKGTLGVGVGLKWIRGHSGNTWNEMADEMCSVAMRELQDENESPEARHMREIARGQESMSGAFTLGVTMSERKA